MKGTKKIISEKALQLFNKSGVANISIRHIAAELGISHSNLIYHYKTKQEIIEALHQQLLERALLLNEETKMNEGFMGNLFLSTAKGFEILYEYRFLMAEINHIMRENEKLKQTFLQVGKVRAEMYREAIGKAVKDGYMRKELFENEYAYFIEHIKIYSDFWISSSEIYDTAANKDTIIKKYGLLFLTLFYPYLTKKGQKEFSIHRIGT